MGTPPKLTPAALLKPDLELKVAQRLKAEKGAVLRGEVPTVAEALVADVYDLKAHQVWFDGEPSREEGSTSLDFYLAGNVAKFTSFARDTAKPGQSLKGWSSNANIWHLDLSVHTDIPTLRAYIDKRKTELEALIARFNDEFRSLQEELVRFAQGLYLRRLDETEAAQKATAALDELGYKPRNK